MSKTKVRSETSIHHQFDQQLQDESVHSVFAHRRILKFNSHCLQVFCSIKKKILLSRDFFIYQGDPFNKQIKAAALSKSYLIVTLEEENSKKVYSKVFKLSNNEEIGVVDSSLVFSELYQMDDHLKDQRDTVSMVAITGNKQAHHLVCLTHPGLQKRQSAAVQIHPAGEEETRRCREREQLRVFRWGVIHHFVQSTDQPKRRVT